MQRQTEWRRRVAGAAQAGGLAVGLCLWCLTSAAGAGPQMNGDANALVIDGATSLYPVAALSQWRFPQTFPGTMLTVTQTASGHGQAAILAGAVDVALSSSACSDANGGADGYPKVYVCSQLVQTPVARDAVTIIVNPAVTCVKRLTRAQLQGLWEGTIWTWNALSAACPAAMGAIVPRAGSLDSGARAVLLALAGIGAAPEQAAVANSGLERLPGNAEMAAAVAADPSQIGYVSLAFAGPQVRTVAVDFGAGPVAPSAATVVNGAYPLSRNLSLLTLPQAFNPKQRVQDYLAWMLAPEAQGMVRDLGYLNLAPAAPAWDVNLDGVVDIGDVSTIGIDWGQTQTMPGWIRADVTFDGVVDIADVGVVGTHWGETWSEAGYAPALPLNTGQP